MASKIKRGDTLPLNPKSGNVFIDNSGGATGLYICIVDGAWVGPLSTGGSNSLSLETPTGVVGEGNKVFVFSAPPVMVFYQSVLQNNSGVDYSLVGSTVTFVVAPTSGLVLGLVSA